LYHLGGDATGRKMARWRLAKAAIFPVRRGVIPMRALRSRGPIKSSMTLSAVAIGWAKM
jgi:hypothetical protein